MYNVVKGRIHIIVIVLVMLAASIIFTGAADGVLPGSQEDPLVTESFVEQKVEQIKYYIDSISANINTEVTGLKNEVELLKNLLIQKDTEIKKLQEDLGKVSVATAPQAAKFVVVQLTKNQVLIAGDGAEIIPRSGKMVAVYGKNGGLSDITSAKDLKAGEAVVLNHMLIASRNDGRGIKAVAESFLIIKGEYVLK